MEANPWPGLGASWWSPSRRPARRAPLHRGSGQLSLVPDVQLGPDPLDVGIDRRSADAHPGRGLRMGQAPRDQVQSLLPGGQRRHVGRSQPGRHGPYEFPCRMSASWEDSTEPPLATVRTAAIRMGGSASFVT